MIVNKLNIFSQNICKNALIVNSILEMYNHFDIILIQELPLSIIQLIPSSASSEGEVLVRSPHYPNLLSFTRSSTSQSDYLRVLAYINIHLSFLQFSLCRDIINHRDIILIYFFSNDTCFFIINIYSDTFQSALKYLKDTEVNINNLILMIGDFNIRDSLWDPLFPHHSSISDDLFILADLFNLDLSTPTDPIPTRYSNIPGELDLVIDLMFFHSRLSKLNCHSIYPSWRLTSNYAPLTIIITIEKEHVMTSKFSLLKDSEDKEEFIKEVTRIFKLLNNIILRDQESLEQVIDLLVASIKQAWNTNARRVRIMKHSKIWWNKNCRRSLNTYRE